MGDGNGDCHGRDGDGDDIVGVVRIGELLVKKVIRPERMKVGLTSDGEVYPVGSEAEVERDGSESEMKA